MPRGKVSADYLIPFQLTGKLLSKVSLFSPQHLEEPQPLFQSFSLCEANQMEFMLTLFIGALPPCDQFSLTHSSAPTHQHLRTFIVTYLITEAAVSVQDHMPINTSAVPYLYDI